MSITLTLIGCASARNNKHILLQRQLRPEGEADTHQTSATGEGVGRNSGMRLVSTLRKNVVRGADHRALQGCYCVEGDVVMQAVAMRRSEIKHTHRRMSNYELSVYLHLPNCISTEGTGWSISDGFSLYDCDWWGNVTFSIMTKLLCSLHTHVTEKWINNHAGRIFSESFLHHFVTCAWLKYAFVWNSVRRALRIAFSHLVALSEVLPNQQQRVNKPWCIKKLCA